MKIFYERSKLPELQYSIVEFFDLFLANPKKMNFFCTKDEYKYCYQKDRSEFEVLMRDPGTTFGGRSSFAINHRTETKGRNLIILSEDNKLIQDIYYSPWCSTVEIVHGSRMNEIQKCEIDFKESYTEEEYFQMSTVHDYADIVSLYVHLSSTDLKHFRMHFDDFHFDEALAFYKGE